MEAIFIVSGHGRTSTGSRDPGATGPNYLTGGRIEERTITANIGGMLIDALRANTDIKVYEIGVKEDLNISQKTEKINTICKAEGYDYTNSLLISLHVDYRLAPTGVCAYHYGGSLESKEFADVINNSTSKELSRPIRWNKPDTASRFGRLGIVRDTKPLAILFEMGSLGFDLDYLTNRQSDLVKGIVDGVLEYVPEATITETQVSSFTVDTDNIEKLSNAWKKLEDAQNAMHDVANYLRSIS